MRKTCTMPGTKAVTAMTAMTALTRRMSTMTAMAVIMMMVVMLMMLMVLMVVVVVVVITRMMARGTHNAHDITPTGKEEERQRRHKPHSSSELSNRYSSTIPWESAILCQALHCSHCTITIPFSHASGFTSRSDRPPQALHVKETSSDRRDAPSRSFKFTR